MQAQFFPSPRDWREVPLYMIFTDRFADGDPSKNELTPGATFEPHAPRGIHGGDFRGIERHLDYIRGLGARAIWITPVFLNEASTAWHGYGAVDFTTVSPQLGGLAGLRRLIRSAHRRGMYVLIDVVANHLGGVATSDDPGWPKFRRQGEGYHLRWTSPATIPPAPFNDLSWFHNRGQIEDWNDPVQSVIGQFFTLCDLRTELPEVRAALINVYQRFIRETDCDGFRVDTVRHVEASFWAPWCTAIREYAQSLGKTNFLLCGEVAVPDDRALAPFTGPTGRRERAFDSLLDFAFAQAVTDVVCRNAPTRRLTERFARLTHPPYSRESLHQLVTFIDNHDQPRFLASEKSAGEIAKLKQALVLLYTMTGIPCLYYGTEQGFHGGGDPHNREDMIARGSNGKTTNHFNSNHSLYRFIARLHELRAKHPSLRVGRQTVLADNADGPGLFVFVRQHGKDRVLVTLNTSQEPRPVPPLKLDFPPATILAPTLEGTRRWPTDRAGRLVARTIPPRSVEIWVARRL